MGGPARNLAQLRLPPAYPTSEQMTNDDRVSEVYYGNRGTAEAQRICRDRISWILSKITGPRVLDIGCSQGITSILAGRAGHEVLGVDIEQPQIEFARAELEKEPED